MRLINIIIAGLILTICMQLVCDAAADNSKKINKAEIDPRLLTAKPVQLDSSLFVTPEWVLKKIAENQKLVLVDLRDKKKFEQFRMPNSINLPLYSLKTKAVLKSKEVVIFNEGYNYLQLVQETEKLRKSGFAVSILQGGLNGWRAVGGRLDGDVFAMEKMNEVPSSVLFQEKDCSNWLILDVSEKQSQDLKSFIPQIVWVPFTSEGPRFPIQIEDLIKERKQISPLFVLIADNNGTRNSQIEKLLSGKGLKQVFYLQDGYSGYRKFLETQTLMWHDENKRKVSTKKCSKCP